ncbi:hypothetical protein [Rickettsia canadensis]|uniref:hypothetical protein n=1 Tax=Rickettsia canadensis TaxID=788 RepID=UPI0038B44C16
MDCSSQKSYLVTVEKDIGLSAGFLDEEYIVAGAKIFSVPLEIISNDDIILKVQPSSVRDKYSLEFAKAGAIISVFYHLI